MSLQIFESQFYRFSDSFLFVKLFCLFYGINLSFPLEYYIFIFFFFSYVPRSFTFYSLIPPSDSIVLPSLFSSFPPFFTGSAWLFKFFPLLSLTLSHFFAVAIFASFIFSNSLSLRFCAGCYLASSRSTIF